jgi:hypothetical protein
MAKRIEVRDRDGAVKLARRNRMTSTARYSAAIRIHGVPQLHAEISSRLGPPTEAHVAGDVASAKSGRTWRNDIWMLDAPLSPEADLALHVAWLAELVEKHQRYIGRLIGRHVSIDLYCTYRSAEMTGGFAIPSKHLRVFARLGIPLGVSVHSAR